MLRLALLLVLLLTSVVGLAVHQERDLRLRRAQGSELVYLPPAWLAKHLTFGHRYLMADYAWLQALQYYGNEWNRLYFYRDLGRYLDLSTDIDPAFTIAYRFGAASIPFNSGGWTWHNVPQSNELIEKGLRHDPNDWQLWLQLGFNRGVIGTDYEGAAEAYRNAARSPGAPTWIPQLVTRLYATAGSMDRARMYAQQILASTDEPELRETMERRLWEIDLEEQLVKIDEALRRYRADHGEDPAQVNVLVTRGYLKELPEDPFGGVFYIENGEARSSSLHKGRLRVHEEEAEREKHQQ